MNNEIKTHGQRLIEHGFVNHEHNGELYQAEIAELRARIESLAADAERFVFEHTQPDAMLKIEVKAINLPPNQPIDWWRTEIDAAIAKEKA